MNQLPKLLSEIAAFARMIPPGYRLPLALMAVLVIGVITTIIVVSSGASPPPQLPPVVVMAPVVTPASQHPVTDLFDPTAEQNAAQKRESAALAQIDNILLNCYLLTKCNKMKPEEYNDTYQLLLVYAKLHKLAPTVEAADAIVRERAKAAASSYELVYSHASCSDIDKVTLMADLDRWRQMTRLAPIREMQ